MKFDIGVIFGMIMCVGIGLGMLLMFSTIIYDSWVLEPALEEYCIQEGWKGQRSGDQGYVCYNEIKHQTGTGTYRITSGVIARALNFDKPPGE